MTDRTRLALPVLGQERPERADAARNRRALLAAAARIVAERGADALSMEDVAAEAGVGVGTVYRRFGNLARLAHALADARERELQAGFLSGPPPLGPGAPPAERIRAFLHAYVDQLEIQAPLLAIAGRVDVDARYDNGAYYAHHMHLSLLLARTHPGRDVAYLADALLAAVDAALYLHQRRTRGMSVRRIKAGLEDLLASL